MWTRARAAWRTLQELEEENLHVAETECTASTTSNWEDPNSARKGEDEEGGSGGGDSGPIFNKISIGTINIRNGNGGNLEMTCNKMQRMGLDIVFVTEAKLKRGRHTSLSYGFEVTATNCDNGNQGGVALLVRRVKKEKERIWHIEDVACFGPNVMKCTLVYGRSRTTLVGVYIPPSDSDLTVMKEVDLALKGTDWKNVVLLGDLNVNYSKPKDTRSDQIVTALHSYNLRDLSTNFKTKKPYTWTWRMFREERWIHSICDYILYGEAMKGM